MSPGAPGPYHSTVPEALTGQDDAQLIACSLSRPRRSSRDWVPAKHTSQIRFNM